MNSLKVLLNFSGGVDSTYCLYKYLEAVKGEPEKSLLLHHIKLKNYEGRLKHEEKAVYSILAWLKQQKMTNFKYIESGFDYGSVRYIVKDMEIVMFMTGIILTNPAHATINKVILPNGATDFTRADYSDPDLRRFHILTAILDREVELVFPIRYISKQQMIDELPDDLFRRTWFCRRPIREHACGKCIPCREVREARIAIERRKRGDVS